MRLALTVMVEVPGGVTGFLLKDTLTNFSCPDADNVTGAAPPLTRVTAITYEVLLPRATLIDVLAAESEKTGGGAVTVSVTVVLSGVPLEGVPVTVMLYVPAATVDATVKVNCEEVPLPEIGFGEKPAEIPVGRPVAESVT